MAPPLVSRGFHRNSADATHSQTGDVLVIRMPGESTGTHSRQLHVAQSGDSDLDFNIAAQSHPTVYIHSVTTPITDYLSIGGHDGTTATIDVVGGTTLVLAASGTTQLTMNAVGLVIANAFGLLIGATSQVTGGSVSELQVLGTAVADSSILVGKWVADATGPEIEFVKSNNATIGSLTTVADNDVCGRIVWNPDDSADFATEAAIFQAEVDDSGPEPGGVGMAFVWSSQIGGGTTAAEEHMRLAATGSFFLNQQAQDVVHLTLQSSDVATGLTTIVKGGTVTTEDYFTVGKLSSTLGGAHIQALAESTQSEALFIEAWGGPPVTVDTITSLGLINIFGGQHNGSNADTDMAGDSNLLVIGEIDATNTRITRFLLKGDDGELHLGDTTLVAVDEQDDIMLVRALQHNSSPDGRGIIESQYDNPFWNQDKLVELGINYPKAKDGFGLFRLQPRLSLHEGAMWQMFNDYMGIAEALPPDVQAKLPERVRDRLNMLETPDGS